MTLLKTKNSELVIDDETARIISWKQLPGQGQPEKDLLFPAASAAERPGGIPCILPWFGVGPLELGGTDPDFPKHAPFTQPNWVRFASQEAPGGGLENSSETGNQPGQSADLAPADLEPAAATCLRLQRNIAWDQDPYTGISHLSAAQPTLKVVFTAQLVSGQSSDSLEVTLHFENLSDQPQSFEAALHTYFAFEQPKQTKLQGLDGCLFDDATQPGHQAQTQTGELAVNQGLDRIFYLHPVPVEAGKILPDLVPQISLEDGARPLRHHQLLIKDSDDQVLRRIEMENWNNAIVWFPDDGRPFLCVESASCRASGISLPAGGTHFTKLRIS